MTYVFLDSSALIKRYIDERGSDWVRVITSAEAGNVIVVSCITPVEVVSGAMRRVREGTIPVRTGRAIRLVSDRHARRDFEVVDLSLQVIASAENLLERYELRAYDSIQLASAIVSRDRLSVDPMPGFMLVAADRRLLAAAASEGLITENPNDYS